MSAKVSGQTKDHKLLYTKSSLTHIGRQHASGCQHLKQELHNIENASLLTTEKWYSAWNFSHTLSKFIWYKTQPSLGTFSTSSILVKLIHFCIISLCLSMIFWCAVNCRLASSRSCTQIHVIKYVKLTKQCTAMTHALQHRTAWKKCCGTYTGIYSNNVGIGKTMSADNCGKEMRMAGNLGQELLFLWDCCY